MAKGAEDGMAAKLASLFSEEKRRPGEKGALWKLPPVQIEDLGKLGPGLGLGIGCGAGVGVGIFGGVGLGAGLPGFQLGVGLGAGCGIGLGVGYGAGKGVAFDGKGKYTNVGKLYRSNLLSLDAICALVDEVGSNTKKLVIATSKKIEKWTGADNDQVKK